MFVCLFFFFFNEEYFHRLYCVDPGHFCLQLVELDSMCFLNPLACVETGTVLLFLLLARIPGGSSVGRKGLAGLPV